MKNYRMNLEDKVRYIIELWEQYHEFDDEHRSLGYEIGNYDIEDEFGEIIMKDASALKVIADENGEELSEKDGILVYPSPITDFLTLKLANNIIC